MMESAPPPVLEKSELGYRGIERDFLPENLQLECIGELGFLDFPNG